jgi:hypothetical protein
VIRPTRADPGIRAHADGRSTRVADEQPLAASWDPQPPPVGRHGVSGTRTPGRLARVMSIYGWRVYALPLLVVLTVLAVLDAARSPLLSPSDQAGTSGAARNPLIPNPVSGPGFDAVKASAELPGGGPFTVQGAGTWRVIPGAGAPFGTGQLVTYTVEVEDGVELEGGPAGFATTVDSTLHNPKSWIGSGRYQFQRIDNSRAAALRISLTSQETTRRLCGFRIPFDASCWQPENHRGDQRCSLGPGGGGLPGQRGAVRAVRGQSRGRARAGLSSHLL